MRPRDPDTAAPPEGVEQHDETRSTGRAVRKVSALTVLSRIAGLIRDLVTVRIFGDTAVGSAFAAAFAIPNLFRRLFGEGALSAAFLPAYTRLLRDDPPAAGAIASLVVGLLAVVTGVLTLIGGGALIALVLALPDDPDRSFSLLLVAAMLPYMPLICVAAILGGMLQANGRFAPWAAAPIILNACILIACAPFFAIEGADPHRWAFYIAGAVIVAGVAQVLWSLRMLRGRCAWTRRFDRIRGEARDLVARILPALVGLGTLQLNAMIDTLIAMWPNWVGPTMLGLDYPLDEASNAVLFYAQRLYQFPLGVFGIAVATVVFPQLARASGDPSSFVRTLRNGLRLSLFIALPASVGLAFVRNDLVATLYAGFGAGFSASGIERAASVVLGYSVAIWSYSLVHVFTRAFYATGDTTTPMRVALGTVALNLVLNFSLIWPFAEAGLAWSTAISSVAQCALLASLSRTKLLAGPLLDRETARAVGGTAAGAAAMGLVVGAILWFWPDRSSWALHAGALGAAVVAGAGSYALFAAWTRAPELRWLLGRAPAAGGGRPRN